MLKQWAISIGFAAGLALGTSAIAAGDECAAKQHSADKAVPAAEKTAAPAASTATEGNKQAVATK